VNSRSAGPRHSSPVLPAADPPAGSSGRPCWASCAPATSPADSLGPHLGVALPALALACRDALPCRRHQAGKDLGVKVPELGAQSESDINGEITILEKMARGRALLRRSRPDLTDQLLIRAIWNSTSRHEERAGACAIFVWAIRSMKRSANSNDLDPPEALAAKAQRPHPPHKPPAVLQRGLRMLHRQARPNLWRCITRPHLLRRKAACGVEPRCFEMRFGQYLPVSASKLRLKVSLNCHSMLIGQV
jgi:hypothetical protein